MTAPGSVNGRSRNLVLAAMIFAVAMTFIDQTIVSIAAPNIQKELHLSNTGIQWAINSYLLVLAALFAFGGRRADTVGQSQDGRAGGDNFRRRVGHLRSDAEGECGRGVDRYLSCRAVPCRARVGP
jgi:hypothetical protein